MLRRFAPLALLCLWPALLGDGAVPAQAQPGAVPGLFGASLRTVSISPADHNELYVTSVDGNAWRSTDAGASWRAGDPYEAFAAPDPSTPGTVYLAAWGGSIFRSTDGGAHRTLVYLGTTTGTVEGIGVSPSGTVYAATDFGGVMHSADDGRTWQTDNQGLPGSLSSTGEHVVAFALAPSGNVAYVSFIHAGAFRLENGAWTPLPTPDVYPITSFAVSPADEHTVYIGDGLRVDTSSDGGDTWTRLPGLADLSGPDPSTLAIAPSQPQTLYIELRDGIERSDDGGQTWSQAVDVFQGEAVQRIAVDPADADAVYAAVPAGLFRSNDGGQTWQPLNHGLLSDHFVAALASDPADPRVVYAGTQGGFWRSGDGGGTWSYIASGLLPGTSDVNSVTLDPANPSTVYIHASTGYYVSHDEGRTWTVVRAVWHSGQPAVAVDPDDSGHLVWPDGYGVDVSHDGGHTYQYHQICCNATSDPYEFDSATFAPGDPGVIYVGATGGVWRSADDGNSWALIFAVDPSNLVSPTAALAADPNRPGLMYYANTNGQLYLSRDRGESWQPTHITDATSLTLDTSVTPSTAYVQRDWNLPTVRSVDGGATWVPEADPPTASQDAAALAGRVPVKGLVARARQMYLGNRTVRKHTFIAATPRTLLTLTHAKPVTLRTRTRRLTVDVRCTDDWHERCHGDVAVRVHGRTIATAHYALRPRRTAAVRLALPRHLWQRIAAGARLDARVWVRSIGQDRTLVTDRRRVDLAHR